MKRLMLGLSIVVLAAAGTACSSSGGSASPDAARQDAGVDGPPASSLTPQELVDACLRASACKIKEYPSIFNCVDSYYELYVDRGEAAIYDGIFRCVNQAGVDCDAIADCFGRRGACDKNTAGSCEGTVAVSCDLIDKRIYTIDCAGAGLTCKERTGGDAICTAGSCAAGFETQCVGTQRQSCGGDAIEVEYCGAKGLLCGDVWFTKQACRGETETKCDKNFKPRCEGTKAVSCVTFREHFEDCTQHAFRRTSCSAGKCVPKGSACSGGEANRCNGELLEACLDGEWLTFDCAKIGFGPCKPSTYAGANCTQAAAP